MFWVLQWLCGSCTGFQFNPVKVGNGTLLFPKAVIELRMTGEDDLCRVSSRKVTYHDTFRNPCTHSSLVWSDVLTVIGIRHFVSQRTCFCGSPALVFTTAIAETP